MCTIFEDITLISTFSIEGKKLTLNIKKERIHIALIYKKWYSREMSVNPLIYG